MSETPVLGVYDDEKEGGPSDVMVFDSRHVVTYQYFPQPVQSERDEPSVHKVPFYRQDLFRNGIPGRKKKGTPKR